MDVSICSNAYYLFEGDTLREAGVYEKSYTASSGCDSIILLDLAVDEYFESPIQTLEITADSFLVVESDTLREAGLYSYTFKNIAGCDSIVHYRLVVLSETNSIYLPNTVNSSSNTRENQGFYLQSKFPIVYELWIYDRWGNNWFHKKDLNSNIPSEGWLPKNELTSGIYIYMLRYEEGGKEQVKSGEFLLLK